MDTETRIELETFRKVLEEKLVKHGVEKGEAEQTALIFERNAADGVISHSVLRAKRLVMNYDKGVVVSGNRPTMVSSFAAVERFDANHASGVIAASFCMNRACELSDKYGIGMVALRHANHWMRGGYYGWLAADRGKVGICWTNTRVNMPSWGSRESNIGNNPFIMAVPGECGKHFVLDSAMAQFSNGKLEVMRRAEKPLPVPGGYDESGNLTCNAAEVEKTKRPVPMGFWKGSAMSILLDAAAALLSDGNDSASVERNMKKNGVDESQVSQIFIAIDPKALGENDFAEIERSIKESVHNAQPVEPGRPSRYPGERVISDRAEAYKNGIMVPTSAWEEIKAL